MMSPAIGQRCVSDTEFSSSRRGSRSSRVYRSSRSSEVRLDSAWLKARIDQLSCPQKLRVYVRTSPAVPACISPPRAAHAIPRTTPRTITPERSGTRIENQRFARHMT